jgi:hypothetical protein
MDALQFAYWLQGFVELNGQQPTPEQWQSIREHLQLVFKKVTPTISIPQIGYPSSPVVSPSIPTTLPPLIATC